MKTTITNLPKVPTKSFTEMMVGEIGRITSKMYNDHVVVKASPDCVCSLTGETYWTHFTTNSLQVEILPAGTKITLEVE